MIRSRLGLRTSKHFLSFADQEWTQLMWVYSLLTAFLDFVVVIPSCVGKVFSIRFGLFVATDQSSSEWELDGVEFRTLVSLLNLRLRTTFGEGVY